MLKTVTQAIQQQLQHVSSRIELWKHVRPEVRAWREKLVKQAKRDEHSVSWTEEQYEQNVHRTMMPNQDGMIQFQTSRMVVHGSNQSVTVEDTCQEIGWRFAELLAEHLRD